MIASYTTTQVIAAFLGLYMLAAGVGMLRERDVWAKVIDGVADNPALGYMAGILGFSLSAVIVALHNRWGTPLEVVVSLIGWVGLVEGVLMLAFRRPFIRIFARLAPSEAMVRIFAGLIVVIGVVLLYAALL